MPGVVPPQVQDSALPLFELHELLVSPFLQRFMVPLNRNTNILSTNHSSQIFIVCLPEMLAGMDQNYAGNELTVKQYA